MIPTKPQDKEAMVGQIDPISISTIVVIDWTCCGVPPVSEEPDWGSNGHPLLIMSPDISGY